ncbi:putative heme-binding domain-containing protein [Pontibacter ummariensis]|uniref:Putative heme-binding domain-containing protein n=1 Tax=Pontibacter ummariensis TaxID=1610492 RepID=A0A239LY90_9BACT|nr:c-type cytochrome [Pontibacter ummariensis]PRX99404.1 putative heme-binding domain-containing protein [Pontibacter ummariensis]SNT35486.1 putative heme-binding domain-containing protein [Pontibacter ummariensis]
MLHNILSQRLKLLLALSVSVIVDSSCSRIDKEEIVSSTSIDPKVEKLKLPTGFQAEHLYSPSENEQGSWVSMTFDSKGRLITSDQYGALYRLELPPVGSESVKPKIEKLIIGDNAVADTTKTHGGMGYAQGLLWAFNSLYVMVNHNSDEDFSRGSGLYRLQDTNGDDQFDKVTLLKELKGEGEHGPHSIKLSPDKKSLYVVAGNHTDIPQMNAYRLPPVWKEDNLFPQIKDPRGHANDREAPGGWIAKVDSLGQHWELISAGFRNPFDIAFNDAGDLFTYDSDMEWDFGMPWYRPTRICHVTSGSEFGWRTGNGKWSPAYPDNLPPVLNIGQGSPTNVVYGGEAKFPEKYRKAIYAFDWSFGIIYAVHLQPEGASYKAEAEEFISGSPLALTDGVIGPDGALYFLTGGRRLESDLYRVYYNDKEGNAEIASNQLLAKETEASKIRKQLEQYHGQPKAGAVDFAWPYLKHNDRFVRYAARIAVEHQPVSQWQTRALSEKDPQILTQAMIALARHGNKAQRDHMLESLMTIDYAQLSEPKKLDLLRAFELVLYRHGTPGPALVNKTIAYLDARYPAESNNLNRSFSKLLVSLDAPQVVPKTLALLDKAKDDKSEQETAMASSDLILRNPQYGLDIAGMLANVPPAQQTYLATALSEAKTGWTPELREKYFKWMYNAFNYKGGRSYIGFVDKARKAALAHVPKNQYEYYNAVSGDSLLSKGGIELADVSYSPKGPGRKWTVEEALPLVESGLAYQNLEQGKAIFAATLCKSCHSMGGEGGFVGPDLTQLGNRFTPRDILEAIIHPDSVISDQYAATVFYLKDGSSVVGRLTNENKNTYFVSQNPFAPQTLREIPKGDVTGTKQSDVSPMVPNLINRLNPDELKDLMAYLISAGNKEHKVYTTSLKVDSKTK